MTTRTASPATTSAYPWADQYTRIALDALPTDITTAEPAQVDEVIRTVQLDAMRADAQIGGIINTLHLALGHVRHSDRDSARKIIEWWVDTDGAVVEPGTTEPYARTLPADTPSLRGWRQPRTVGEILESLDAVRANVVEMSEVEQVMHAEFARREGWSRYFRVDNSNGHVHRTTSCRETYATTRWTWPTLLSGGTAQDVVEAAGALSCLTCFPEVRGTILENRPIDPTRFETPEGRDARKAAEQEAKAKRDAKIAKAVTADGRPLRISVDRVVAEVKTERGAELRYLEWASDAARYQRLATAQPDRGFTHEVETYRAAADEVIAALAWKRGRTVEQMKEDLAAKLQAKIKRETY